MKNRQTKLIMLTLLIFAILAGMIVLCIAIPKAAFFLWIGVMSIVAIATIYYILESFIPK